MVHITAKGHACKRCKPGAPCPWAPADAAAAAPAVPDIADAAGRLRWLWSAVTRALGLTSSPREIAALAKSAESLGDTWDALHPPQPERSTRDAWGEAIDADLDDDSSVRG